MSVRVIFMFDNDKDFMRLYSYLLQNKGCQVFATDNLFLLIKYAQSALPEWIFIDEDHAAGNETQIVNIIKKGLPFNSAHFAVMSRKYSAKNPFAGQNLEFIYKPDILKKIMEITENSCIIG